MTESLVITRITHSCHLIQIGSMTDSPASRPGDSGPVPRPGRPGLSPP